jgi:hypothetical protein
MINVYHKRGLLMAIGTSNTEESSHKYNTVELATIHLVADQGIKVRRLYSYPLLVLVSISNLSSRAIKSLV